MQHQESTSPLDRALAGCAYMASGCVSIYLMPSIALFVRYPVYQELTRTFSADTARFWSEAAVWLATGICFFGIPAIVIGVLQILRRPRLHKARKF